MRWHLYNLSYATVLLQACPVQLRPECANDGRCGLVKPLY